MRDKLFGIIGPLTGHDLRSTNRIVDYIMGLHASEMKSVYDQLQGQINLNAQLMQGEEAG